MRPLKYFLLILSLVIFSNFPAHSQWIPQNVAVDASFRTNLMISSQSIGQDDDVAKVWGTILVWNSYKREWVPTPAPFPNPNEALDTSFNNTMLLLDAVVEVSPMPAFSARMRGNVSVTSTQNDITLGAGPYGPGQTDNTLPPAFPNLTSTIKPQYWSWEAAGQYNMSYEAGYRFGLVGGYRYESQSYLPVDDHGGSSYISADFISQIPFLGLQTSFISPFWKARFEILGSPFMTKKLSHSARGSGAFMELDGSMTNGGFLEVQAEGSIAIAPNTWLGVFTQGTFEELKGEVWGRSVDGNGAGTYVPSSYNFYAKKGIWLLGLNCSLVF